MGDSGSLLASLRVLDLRAVRVTRSAASWPISAPRYSRSSRPAEPGPTALPRLGGTSVAFALHNANKRSAVLDPAVEGDRQRLLDLAGAADIVIDSGNSRPGSGLRHLVRGPGRPLRAPRGAVGDRLRDDGPALGLAGHRRSALRAVVGPVAVRAADRHARATTGRNRVGHRRGAGSLGRAGRPLPPVALRPWRLHRLLPL